MLPSRGIARALPSQGVWRQFPNQPAPSRALAQRLGNGRSFGTALRGPSMAAASPLRSRTIAIPTVLAGVSSSRSISFWGSGHKTPAEPVPMPAAPTEEIIQPPEPILSNQGAAPSSSAGVDPSVAAPDLEMSSIADLLNNDDILNMPETLGYLHAVGLDYGWGPTSVMAWVLEHIHVWGGVGWGGAIIGSAFLLRLVMLYPQIQSLKFAAKASKMKEDPRSKEAMELTAQGWRESDPTKHQKGAYMQKLLKKEYDMSTWGFVWGFLPIPFSFGLFRIISGMSAIPVPSLESAGWLWFSNLTVADPYYVLPFASSIIMCASMLINLPNVPPAQRGWTKKAMPILAVVIGVLTTWLSAGINLMGVAFGVATCVSTAITMNPLIRRNIGLPPVLAAPTKPTNELSRPAAGVAERLKESLTDVKKGFDTTVSNVTGSAALSASAEDKAEKNRKDLMRKLEASRKKQEREAFEKKYKGGGR